MARPCPRFAASLAAALALTASAAAGCDANSFSGDAFPIVVEPGPGPLLIHVREGDDGPDQLAVIDLMSPLTVLDRGADAEIRQRDVTLTVLGRRTPASTLLVPRARLHVLATDLHPCALDASCAVGDPAAPAAITAIIGADALAGDAVRLELGAQRIFILPDIAPADAQGRARACDAVMPSPFHGGGTLVLGGAEVAFSGRRIALSACLSPPPEAPTTTIPGVDAVVLVSTGIGPTVLAASAYRRWLIAQGRGDEALPTTPPATVLLPSGPLTGVAATIDAMALIGRSPRERGPCAELAAHRDAVTRHCAGLDTSECSAAGAIELRPTAPIDVVVVADDEPTLQALRDELRPELPELDGIVGTAALAALSLDVDYPHDRVLIRCAAGATSCSTRPTLSFSTRVAVEACLAAATTP